MTPRAAIASAISLLSLTLPAPTGAAATTEASREAAAPTCGESLTTLTGSVTPADAKTYQLRPFVVPAGTARIEVGYAWDPVGDGVIDLGVWDARGTSGPQAFRSWSGSRQGRLDQDMDPEVIAPDRNERTVGVGPIMAGTWHVELGIAAVSKPLTWRVEIRCPRGTPGPELAPDPVDPTHVARAGAGWYAGDFHLHGFHSNPKGLDPEAMVRAARDAGLDIVPVTEYVTPAHWDRLGAVQRDHPDVLVWPGREVITYFGHMIVLSETRGEVEYRVGHDGVTIGDIQRRAAAEGGLVSIAHPTIFPPEVFGSACRGCFFQLLDQVDWPSTGLMEVVTEGSMPEVGGRQIPNPFVRTAVELWERELRAGHRLTAVSGSDSKTGPGYGSTSTMVHAAQLSRAAVDEALRRGHAFVRGLGRRSPTMELTATGGGSTVMMGDTLVARDASMTVTVRGAVGDVVALRRNGREVQRLTVDADPFVRTVAIDRGADEGPLGTFWGAEVFDPRLTAGAEVPIVIANPVFLADRPAPEPTLPRFSAPSPSAETGTTTPTTRASSTRATSSATPALLAGVGAALAAAAVVGVVRRRRRGGR